MEERKHIDRLYQEKFKDFEATPREAVWKNISSRLEEKNRKRRVLPLWYKLAGVAALLALLFNFANDLFKTNLNSSRVATELDENFGEFDLASSAFTQKMIKSSIILQALMQDTELQKSRENVYREKRSTSLKSAVTFNRELPAGVIDISRGPTAGIISLSEGQNLTFAELEMAANRIATTAGTIKPAAKLRELPLPIQEENIEDDFFDTKISAKRIRVTTTAAPIYYDNLGKGNAIDTRFANNESEGEVTMSYGINFAYQISDKIKIRSGISKVDISHNTRNIAFTAAVHPIALSGIDYAGNVPNFRIENRNVRSFSNIYASTQFDRASLATPTSGYLNQRMGFIEVPVEIEYAIIDKKFGLNIIGGGSTLFLDENSISLNSSNFSTILGEANNLNSVSFTTNIGLGLDYNLSPQFQLNLEPIFKYQVNTFNSISTRSLNPYYFGIYTGFSFKF